MPFTKIIDTNYLNTICEEHKNYATIPASAYTHNVKRGLRNEDGTGVVAGLTTICSVHGYVINEGEKEPDEGILTYKGYNIIDIIEACVEENRYGFEEVTFLLMFGFLPTKEQLAEFVSILSKCRELPQNFTEDMIIKAPSNNIMNKLARSVLALYSYDDYPDDTKLSCLVGKALLLIARFPVIVSHAFQVKKHYYDHESMYLHFPKEGMSTSETLLRTLRPDKQFSEKEARLLDIALILHAEHGGGNNSTFAARVVASTGTDIYSAVAAAVGSLKGPKHGGANIKVVEMLNAYRENVKDFENLGEVADFTKKILNKEAGDKSGLVYGMGHAIYTTSDPRAIVLKKYAKDLAAEKGMLKEFALLENIETCTPQVFEEITGKTKVICANVDLYSGFVYEMLGIPNEVYTPLFACARITGWCAHIIEEFTQGKKLIRPAYKTVGKKRAYQKIEDR